MNILKLTGTTLLISSAIAITGCSDDGSGSGSSAAGVPANAIIITETNAETTAGGAMNATDIVLAKGAQPSAGSASNVINNVISNAINNAKSSGIDLVTGITESITETYDCSTGFMIDPALAGTTNTYTDALTMTIDANYINFSGSGAATFTDCNQFGATLNGSVNFSFNENDDTGVWSSTASGNLTMILDSDPGTTITISNLAMNDSGSWITGDYVTTRMQFTFDPGTEGFALNMTTNIEGSDYECGPTAGVVEISGASGSKARVTFNADMSVTLETNTGDGGAYVEVPANTLQSCILT